MWIKKSGSSGADCISFFRSDKHASNQPGIRRASVISNLLKSMSISCIENPDMLLGKASPGEKTFTYAYGEDIRVFRDYPAYISCFDMT